MMTWELSKWDGKKNENKHGAGSKTLKNEYQKLKLPIDNVERYWYNIEDRAKTSKFESRKKLVTYTQGYTQSDHHMF